jgi:hypothetical protein
MSIRFRCPGCDTLMQVGDDAAGRKARCPHCRAVIAIPAPAGAAPAAKEPTPAPPDRAEAAAPEEESVSPSRPEKPRKKADAAPRARSRRFDDEEYDDEPRPRRGRQQTSSSATMWIVAGVSGLVLVCAGCLGVGVWLLIPWVFPNLPDAADDAPNRPAGPVAGAGGFNPAPNPGGNPPAPNPARPMEPQKPPEPPPNRPAEAPPTQMVLVNGKFEADVPADAPPQAGARYQFETKADAVDRIQVTGNQWASARVLGRVGPLPQPRDRFGNELRQDFAFLAPQGGTFTVSVDHGPCRLAIRELGPDDVLPDAQRIRADAPADFPTLHKTVEGKVWCSALAFSPDNKAFWMAHMDATLAYWDHPGMLRKGSYKLGTKDKPQGLTVMGVDRKGRLYGQLAANTAGVRLEAGTADISVWENLAPPDRDNVPMPAPTRTIPLRGVVRKFVNAPGGRWLYFLDVNNRKLVRIDPEKGAADREIDTISPGTQSFCVTADGKKIYCCSNSNRVDVIDAEAFKLLRSVRLDRGQPTDIAATNSGLVYMVGAKVNAGPGNSNTMVVDLTHGAPESAQVIPVSEWIIFNSVQVLPDQRAVLFAGDRRITAYSMPSRPAQFSPVGKEYGLTDFFTPNQIAVSPDSRTVLHDVGTILSVSR